MKKTTRCALTSAVLATGALVLGGALAHADALFGGDWYYGTNYTTGNATSSYYHGSESHWTSIGTSTGKYARDDASAGQTASTWLWRPPLSTVTFQAGAKGLVAIR